MAETRRERMSVPCSTTENLKRCGVGCCECTNLGEEKKMKHLAPLDTIRVRPSEMLATILHKFTNADFNN